MDEWIAIQFKWVGSRLLLIVYFTDGESRRFEVPLEMLEEIVEIIHANKE